MKLIPGTQVSAAYLQKSFPDYGLDWPWAAENLQLDLAHIQLLRDFHNNWPAVDEALLCALLCLVDAVNRGALCLWTQDMEFLQRARKLGQTGVQDHLASLNLADLQLNSRQVVMWVDDRLYFQKHRVYEQQLEQRIRGHLNANQVEVYADKDLKPVINEVVNSLPYPLESQQIQALITSILQPFSVISGGPGTGKTTIVLSLLRALIRLGVEPTEVALAAPTGRAAKRMGESIAAGLSGLSTTASDTDHRMTEIEPTTIHRLLGARLHQDKHRYHANNWLPYRLVVVDEVSMVDLLLMNDLLQAIGPHTRLVFLGDQFQLPSVQSGAVLADLMPPVSMLSLNTQSFLDRLNQLWPDNSQPMATHTPAVDEQLLTNKVTILAVSKRCEPHIASLSEWVRRGDVQQFMSQVRPLDISISQPPIHWPEQGGYWMNSSLTGPQLWYECCLSWLNRHWFTSATDEPNMASLLQQLHWLKSMDDSNTQTLLKGLFDLLKVQRILTLTHTGYTGTQAINQFVSRWLQQKLQVTGTTDCFHGAVIMIQRNDATLGLYNGDVGVVLETAPNQYQAVFETSEGFLDLSVHLLPKYQLAYAMTVHKSQGSEFDQVLMPLIDQVDNPLMTREIIYTGMTRAKQAVVIYGSEESLQRAIEHKTSRHSGLRFW